MLNHESVFNKILENSQQKIWSKSLPGFFDCNPELPAFEAQAYKPASDDPTAVEPRIFYIKKNYLYYKKHMSSSGIRGIADLSFMTVKFLEVKEEDVKTHFEFVLMLIRNDKFSRIFLENEEQVRRWREFLTPYCVMRDLRERYEVIEEIGCGGFAKVRKIFLIFLEFLYHFIFLKSKGNLFLLLSIF